MQNVIFSYFPLVLAWNTTWIRSWKILHDALTHTQSHSSFPLSLFHTPPFDSSFLFIYLPFHWRVSPCLCLSSRSLPFLFLLLLVSSSGALSSSSNYVKSQQICTQSDVTLLMSAKSKFPAAKMTCATHTLSLTHTAELQELAAFQSASDEKDSRISWRGH